MHLTSRTEATFVAGVHGRDGTLALWESGSPDDDHDGPTRTGETTICFSDGSRPVPADIVPIGAAVEAFATMPADATVSESVRAWTVGTRIALELIGRGRLVPTIGDDGTDAWRVGPLGRDDVDRVDALAAALPAAAYASPLTDEHDRVPEPYPTVRAFLDAVTDAFVRTGAAPVSSGSSAFAAQGRSDVSVVETWLRSVAAGSGADSLAALRIEFDERTEVVCAVLQVQSRLDRSLVLDAIDLWNAAPAVLTRFGPHVEADLLLSLRSAARAWAPVARLLEDSTPTALVLADAEVEDLFGPVADDLAAAGLPVLWPAEVLRPLEISPVVGPPDQPEPALPGPETPRLDLASLGELRWTAVLDGHALTEAELEQLTEAKRPVVRLRGSWVRADPTRLRHLNERRVLTTGEAMSAALTGAVVVDGRYLPVTVEASLSAIVDRVRSRAGSEAVPTPAALVATLRPYQERGLAWLSEMAELGLGGVLADDMGLGKTIQVLALHLHRRAAGTGGPMLVVCPASVLGNWERESNRFCPDVPVRRFHGAARSLDDLADDEIVLTTYGVIRRDAHTLASATWAMVVADEAQTVKNPTSQTAQALRTIRAPARFALTGTPVENRLLDLWALLDWTTPGLLGSLSRFQRELATPIERDRDPQRTSWLAELVRPFLLRRRKTDPDIAPELPPKTETDRFVGLTVEQATLYRAAVRELLEDVAGADGITRKGRVLRLLSALKQICNHPAQYLHQPGPLAGRSAKLDAVTELVETILDEGDSVLVFSQYVSMGRLMTEWFTHRGLHNQFLHGGTPVGARQSLVDEFQAGPPTAFVISLKAGGTGLNLTRATHVIHVDRWWNPAVEDQASDRAWRIGQDRPVQVHRMICEGTLEERIAELLEVKRGLSDSVIGSGETWITELSDEDLAALVRLDEELG